MIDNLEEIQSLLKGKLTRSSLLKVRVDDSEKFEVCGKIPAVQGKQKVDGFYFASIVPKAKDVRLYFFPVYTHAEQLRPLSNEWEKCLKGKSCFHIKKITPSMDSELTDLIQKSVELYHQEGLI